MVVCGGLQTGTRDKSNKIFTLTSSTTSTTEHQNSVLIAAIYVIRHICSNPEHLTGMLF